MQHLDLTLQLRGILTLHMNDLRAGHYKAIHYYCYNTEYHCNQVNIKVLLWLELKSKYRLTK